MRITKPYRGRKAVKRLDLTDMREVFRDRRVWSSVGVVTIPDGESTWWEIVQHDDGSSVDVLVDVVLHPSETPVTCRLAAGIFDVPDEGDEVAVILPEGAIDFMPIIVCRLSTNSVPTAQGPQPGRIAIIRDQVVVHDGDGGAVSLALKSDVDDLAGYVSDQFDPAGGHTHKAIVPAQPTLIVEGGGGIGPTTVPTAEGTSVLLGK